MYVHEAGDSSISSRDLFDTPVDLSKRLLAHAKKVTKNFREVVVYFVVYNVYLRSWWVGHTECTFSYRFTPCVYTIEYIILTFTSDLRPKITWGFPPPPRLFNNGTWRWWENQCYHQSSREISGLKTMYLQIFFYERKNHASSSTLQDRIL